MKQLRFQPEFVEFIPTPLEEDVLYISITHKTAVHSCACGCGNKVVTPIRPTDWRLEYNGESVSLWPSIGNWNFACRSHYIIRRSHILGAEPWIISGRESDARAKERYFAQETKYRPQALPKVGEDDSQGKRIVRSRGFFRKKRSK